jgi:twitching motility protein PilT
VYSHTESFARSLKAALREDPDVVLVGEMRDLETIALAIETANTGHLVLATLHTSTAISSIDRIINVFPHERQDQIRSMLADNLRGVVSQSLLKKEGGGRIAALEILMVNYAVSNLIREAKPEQIQTIMQTGKARGNILLNEVLAGLVTQRIVSFEEALSKAVDKADLAKRVGKPLPIT